MIERVGLYPGREKVSHADPSLDSFGKAVGTYMSLGRSVRALEAERLERTLNNDELFHLGDLWLEYRAMSEKLEPVRLFVLWCKPGESFKEFKERWANERAA